MKQIMKYTTIAASLLLFAAGAGCVTAQAHRTPSVALPVEAMQLGERMYAAPGAPDATRAALKQGDLFFFVHDWQNALKAYAFADPNPKFIILSSKQRPVYQYRRAISMLETGDLDGAASLFDILKRSDKYRGVAFFYSAYIELERGNLDEARRQMEEAARRALPEGLYPDLYIGEIDFMQGEYAKALEAARTTLDVMPREDEDARATALRLSGMSAFMLDRTTEALPALEEYVHLMQERDENAIFSQDPTAVYAYAASLYDNGVKSKAESLLDRLTSEENLPPAVWQGGLLLLGQLCADTDPNAAALLFERAYRTELPGDTQAAQTALYNYAAARAHGGALPFANATADLEQFAKLYPDSKYTPDVLYSLANQYFNHTDFDAALKGLNRIKNPDSEALALKQRILYRKGIAATIKDQLSVAADDFNAALKLGNYDSELTAQLHLWLGDVLFRSGQYKKAGTEYTAASAGLSGENRALALYNLAYSLMKEEKYKEAAKQMTAALADRSLPATLRVDARLRAGDCLFYAGDSKGAAEQYRLASSEAQSSPADRDYALLRQATALGAAGNTAAKISGLETLRKSAGQKWMPYILEELADTYFQQGDDVHTIAVLTDLIHSYPDVPQVNGAMLLMGKALIRNGNRTEGMAMYERILRERPASDEATEADSELRRLHAEAGTLKQYAGFLATIPGGRQLDAAELEQLAFESATDAFNATPRDITLMRTYVADHPTGRNIAEAYALLAEGEAELGNTQSALEAYRRLEACGGVTYASTAATGIMRLTDSPQERLKYARIILSEGGASAEAREEAKYYEATALIDEGKGTEAVKLLEALAKYPQGEWGARSAVALGEYWLRAGKTDKALKTLTAFIDAGSSETYWLARGYILLADTYTAQGKKSLARQYLETLRDNYPGTETDIKEMIDTRLSKLN